MRNRPHDGQNPHVPIPTVMIRLPTPLTVAGCPRYLRPKEIIIDRLDVRVRGNRHDVLRAHRPANAQPGAHGHEIVEHGGHGEEENVWSQ